MHAYLFLRSNGRSPLLEYLEDSEKRERAYIHATIDKLIESKGRLGPPIAKKVSGKIWELRTPFGNRVFYFVEDAGDIILLDGYTKKRNRIEPHVLKKVNNLYQEYLITRKRIFYESDYAKD